MKRVNVPLMLVTLIASAAHAENNLSLIHI